MAYISNSNTSGAARRAERMVRSGQTPKPAVKQKLVVDPKQKLVVDPRPIKTVKNPPNDAKLLAKLPVTQAHLNTIKKHYGI